MLSEENALQTKQGLYFKEHRDNDTGEKLPACMSMTLITINHMEKLYVDWLINEDPIS